MTRAVVLREAAVIEDQEELHALAQRASFLEPLEEGRRGGNRYMTVDYPYARK